MNAPANDQLGRLRLLVGSEPVLVFSRAGRPMKFARYTGRSLYPGSRQRIMANRMRSRTGSASNQSKTSCVLEQRALRDDGAEASAHAAKAEVSGHQSHRRMSAVKMECPLGSEEAVGKMIKGMGQSC